MSELETLYHREHPTSKKHPRMSRMARAAQFAPFSALVGLEEELDEKCRMIYQEAEPKFEEFEGDPSTEDGARYNGGIENESP